MSNHLSFLPASGIMHSNENFDATENLTGADAIAPDESDTLAAAVSEINADEAGLAAGNDQIDTAAAAADGLETISEKVAEANEGDGIDEATAGIVEASVESLLKIARVGATYKQLGLPSVESFSVKANRISLGRKTCEALDISAKKIWKSIVDAIKKSIEWVRNFFNKIFGAAEKLEKRAAALKESTTQLEGSPEETVLENDSLYNSVRVNGAPVTVQQLNDLAGHAKKLFGHQKAASDTIAKLDDLAKADMSAFKGTEYGLKMADSGTSKRVTADSGTVVLTTPRFPGEVVVFIAASRELGSDSKALGEFASKLRAGSVGLAEKKEEGKSLKTLAISDIAGMAGAVEKFAGEVSEYKRNLTEINSNKEKFIGKLEKFLGKGDGREEGDTKGESEKKAKAVATIFRKLMDEPAASYASNSVRSMAAALQYAELSARQYKKRA